ncbi:J domain-containing protein [Fulvivirga sediminis]|uniref:J domain-containing protein n=1 Tax=Fulvivirga sediminis TaxID=2803949 RepID=A0A937F7S3_9BACT|nr:J domain-containing protein [Fulvivirga sediminis]MBL3655849.1 J domain-containing protein [Fulvivirga sediminis]
MKDYYKILGLHHNATANEVRKAFRKLAREKHPDKSGKDTTQDFIEIYEAYQVLINNLELKVSNSKGQSNDKVSSDTLSDIRQTALGYAKDYTKFNRKILFWIIVYLFLDKETIAGTACFFFGIWTMISGIINLDFVFVLIGIMLIGVGSILARYVLKEILENAR